MPIKNIKLIPIFIIWPQLGNGGCIPAPRKLNPTSNIIAREMAWTKPTITGEIELGIYYNVPRGWW